MCVLPLRRIHTRGGQTYPSSSTQRDAAFGRSFPGPRGVDQPGRRLGGPVEFGGGVYGHEVFIVRAASSEAGSCDYTRCPEPLLYAHPESSRGRASFSSPTWPAREGRQV